MGQRGLGKSQLGRYAIGSMTAHSFPPAPSYASILPAPPPAGKPEPRPKAPPRIGEIEDPAGGTRRLSIYSAIYAEFVQRVFRGEEDADLDALPVYTANLHLTWKAARIKAHAIGRLESGLSFEKWGIDYWLNPTDAERAAAQAAGDQNATPFWPLAGEDFDFDHIPPRLAAWHAAARPYALAISLPPASPQAIQAFERAVLIHGSDLLMREGHTAVTKWAKESLDLDQGDALALTDSVRAFTIRENQVDLALEKALLLAQCREIVQKNLLITGDHRIALRAVRELSQLLGLHETKVNFTGNLVGVMHQVVENRTKKVADGRDSEILDGDSDPGGYRKAYIEQSAAGWAQRVDAEQEAA